MNEKLVSNRVAGPEFFRAPSRVALLSFMLFCLFKETFADSAGIARPFTPAESAAATRALAIGFGVFFGLILLGAIGGVVWANRKRCCSNACRCCSYQSIPGEDNASNTSEYELPTYVPHIDSL